MNRFLLNLLVILTLGIIQVSFLSTWPAPINSLNIILVPILQKRKRFNYNPFPFLFIGKIL